MLLFYIEATLCPLPVKMVLIVIKFGTRVGSDSALTWLTFHGRRSKGKITASQKVVFFFTFLKFISDHIFVLYQFEGDLGIPSSHICVSIRLFNSPHFQISVHWLTNYFEGMVYKSLGRKIYILVCWYIHIHPTIYSQHFQVSVHLLKNYLEGMA